MENILVYTEENIDLLYHEYKNIVYRIAFVYTKRRVDAEDVLQEVFLKYLKSSPRLTSKEHTKAWFIKVTLNCCKSMLSSAWFRKTLPFENIEEVENQEVSDIYNCVMGLPKKYRILILLYYYDGYSIKEISSFLDRNPSTIQTQLMRARKLLKNYLEGEN